MFPEMAAAEYVVGAAAAAKSTSSVVLKSDVDALNRLMADFFFFLTFDF